MSLFSSEQQTESIVKAIVVRTDYRDGKFNVLCMLGTDSKPVNILTDKLFYRDGDFVEIKRTLTKTKEGDIVKIEYTLERNVSLVDECTDKKELLLNALGLTT